MIDRTRLLPEALRSLKEMPHPAGTVHELRTWCSYHGDQLGTSCVLCDEAHGINRAALANETRVRALVEELKHLGIDVGPVKALGDQEPGPNEAVPAMTPEEQRAELIEKLRGLGVAVPEP